MLTLVIPAHPWKGRNDPPEAEDVIFGGCLTPQTND